MVVHGFTIKKSHTQVLYVYWYSKPIPIHTVDNTVNKQKVNALISTFFVTHQTAFVDIATNKQQTLFLHDHVQI
jgi:hypothetical protein